MKYFLAVSFLFASITLFSAENYKEVRVRLNDVSEIKSIYELGLDIDHINLEKDLSVTFFISDSDFIKLKSSPLNYEILIDDWYEYYANRSKMTEAEKSNQLFKSASVYGVTDFDYGSMGGYYTFDEVVAHLDNMRTLFPERISEKEVIGTTIEGRNIYMVKISDNVATDDDEPEVLYTALHHAREPEAMMQMIYFMYYLLQNYGSDAEATYLIENREMYFIPVVNPDGYVYNETIKPGGGGMWRKNRRVNDDNSVGVDLNRNYGPHDYWDAPNGGSSTNMDSDVYRGSAPFSEPETSTIRDFLYERDIKNCLNYHTYGDLLIFPYGALETETPDSAIFREFARDMTKYNFYRYGTDQQTVNYSTRGNSDDYFYDGDMDRKGKIFAMTPEVGHSFWPDQSQIIPLAEENIHPNLYYAWVAGGYAAVTDINLNKEIIAAGDTVLASIEMKNKGLEDLGSFSVWLVDYSDQVQILNGSVEINNLLSRESVSLDNPFQIVVNEDVASGTEISVNIEINLAGTLLHVEEFSFIVGVPAVVFFDTSDTIEENWFTTGTFTTGWSETALDFYSAPTSFTDSKNGSYLPDSKVEMELKEFIDLSGLVKPELSFWTKFEIEKGWDYAQVKIMTEEAGVWTAVGGKYSHPASPVQPEGELVYDGSQLNWVREVISLSDFMEERIKIKFELQSDFAIEMDGWYVDDILVYWYGDGLSNVEDGNPLKNLTYKLEQNYPNPFNPSTVIQYSIPSVETGQARSLQHVSLVIYDIMGKEVRVLVNEQQKPGNYNIKWDASGLASGVYFYKLSAVSQGLGQAFTDIKKMILLR